MAGFRTEKDSLGTKKVPQKAYYGINVARAVENFQISDERLPQALIRALALIKQAAAYANAETGLLDRKRADAIARAADEVADGALAEQFVVDAFQAGAGTSQNMNANEVIANRANELLGGKRGDYQLVHPNDHVNMGQSTNDVFPTAMRVSALLMLPELLESLDELASQLAAKGRELKSVLKSARTHLQDAVPVTLGQEFAAYAAAVSKSRRRIQRASEDLYNLGIGGSAAGTGMNTHPRYRKLIVKRLCELTGLRLKAAPDMREAMQSQACIAELSSALRGYALELGRIANDLRLLGSGPTTGLAEVRLPAVQAGSSIMPGKVNPVIAECTNMVCFQVIGNDLTINLAVSAGQLELNVMMPVMIHNLLRSMQILGATSRNLAQRCIAGIEADVERCRAYAEGSMGMATALAPYVGYLKAAEVAKRSQAQGRSIAQLAAELDGIDRKQLDKILDAASLTRPGIPGKKLK
ncbi:MAG: aspartate ammonia-lyase [Candidatus Alcyoniella australis]|nr:aspartate ammonia-lyase [Candidatus Alcyoniella australis]